MHNRVKSNIPATEKEVKALKEKATTYNALVNLVLTKRKQRACDKDTLLVISKLSKLNPDFYSLWNFRREILLHQYPALNNTDEKLDNEELRAMELDVTTDAIKRNPKSYCAWFHRLWIVERLVIDFDAEFALCAEFLRQDQRNFHCWNYRRALHKVSGRSNEQEFTFSTDKIAENFSNYSAFHHRSKYIDSALSGKDVCAFFESELKLVENAAFTEPDDQSAWWYHQYLFTWIKQQPVAANQPDWLTSTILGQMKLMDDLLSLEENCRWAMNSLIFMIDYLTTETHLRSLVDTEILQSFTNRRTDLLNTLLQIDPNHANRYKYLLENSN